MASPRLLRGASPWFIAQGSFGLVKIRYRSILLSALTFSLLIAMVVTFVDERIHTIEDALVTEVGISSEDFSTRVEQGLVFSDEASARAFFEQLSKLGFPYHGSATTVTMIPVYVLRVAPYALSLALFELCILGLAFTYYLVFFLSPSASEIEAILRLPSACVRMLGLCVWAFLRSMIWIPFIGPLVALYLVPRFALAPVFVLSGRSDILASVTLSIHRTQGMWVRTVLSILLWFFLALILLWSVVVLASIPTVFSPKIGYLVFLVGIQCIVAYTSAFVLVFTEITS
jgi:hypothetical protein